MHRERIIRVAMLLLLALPLSGLQAQQDHFEEDVKDKVSRRKAPSWFHRAKRATPAEQLAYAESLRAAGKYRKALRQYDDLVHTWHNSPEGPAAQLAYADLLLERGKHKRAFDEYQYLFDHYVGYFPADKVLQKQYQIANYMRTYRYARFFGLPGITDPEAALPLYEKILANAPQWPGSRDALLAIAMISEETGALDKAVSRYEELLQRYPDDPQASTAGFLRATCLDRLARSRMRDEDLVRSAITAYFQFIRDNASDPRVSEARKALDDLKTKLAGMYYDRALYYDHTEGNPKAALIAYRDFIRNFPLSPLRGKAEERIREMQENKEENRAP